MITIRRTLAVLAAAAIAANGVYAQDEEFDLGSQRSENQDVLPVPGRKIDHKGIIINPTPQEMTVGEGFLDISKGMNPKVKSGEKIAVRNGVKPVSGAYSLEVSAKGISIVAYDGRGEFYARQTLAQLAGSPAAADGKLPCVSINDWPALPYRGVVEGFYGTPWSHEVRMSLIDFYGKFKMNTYLYGPKDDPYHSCPNWRLPYPADEAANISELIQACRRNHVDFVWAIHPGQDIRWNEEDYRNLVQKFNWMYDLGVRAFAIFFDDISGEGTNPVKQTELLNRLNEDFVKAKGDVAYLTVCPTDYSRLWANPTPQGSLAIYGNTLDPSVEVFWTGDVVCSDLTKETLDWVNSRIRRPAYYWWNYPVTDYARHILMQGPVYGLETSLTADDLSGIVSNPMEHGEASKLALYGVADYAWNPAAYNPIDNWERGLVELMPEASEAYRTFAIHSCDTETGYRRDESWETGTFRLADMTEEKLQALWDEFDKVEKAPAAIEEGCTNQALLRELRPWLAEFGKLGARGKAAIELARIYSSGGNDAEFWSGYLENVMDKDERAAYEAHKSGTMKLQPFYENIMDDMAHGYLMRLTGNVPMSYKGIGSFNNSGTTLTKLMFDGDESTYYTSAMSQRPGDWIGVDLRDVRDVKEISILQGRNSVDDVDYFDHAVLEYSADGRTWQPLIDDMERQYVITWSGDSVKARYVRIRRLDSERKNYASVREFAVNPAHPAMDSRIDTFHASEGEFSVEVPEGVKGYTMLLGPVKVGDVKFVQLGEDGTRIAESPVDGPFFRTELENGVSKVMIEGKADIYEVIAK